MPDSRFQQAERGVQQLFSKASLFSYLAIVLLLLGLHVWFRLMPNRADAPQRSTAVHFKPVRLAPQGFAPLRLAGAWQIEISDPRAGGFSALAVDRDKLMAVTDSGTVIWLPKPGDRGEALIRDLPAGPGTSSFKSNRDSEAVAREPRGHGWWVAFERWNQLWLYDPSFRHAIRKIDFGVGRWPNNKGVEGLAPDGDGLALFPEAGDAWLSAGNGRAARHPLTNGFGYVADATRLTNGRLLAVTRAMTAAGLDKHLVEAIPAAAGGLAFREIAPLPLGATENVEGIAAEPRPGGGTRLWLVTDNDFRPRKATLLVALDLP